MNPTRRMTECTFYPDEYDESRSDAHLFTVKVQYMGKEKYRVLAGLSGEVSRAGNLVYVYGRSVPPFRRWQYRFDYDEAMAMGDSWRNKVKVNGRTWAEWQQFFKERS